MGNITEAFEIIKRINFVPEGYKNSAEIDAPIPIGHGQTNSQPTTVRLMLAWLDPQPGQKILDIGCGSGWTTALLAHIVEKEGKVYAVELVPELKKVAEENCKRIGITNVEFYQASRNLGLPEYAPYERILVSASAKELPTELIDQLELGGVLVIPVKNDVLEITKTSGFDYETKIHRGFMFVPLSRPPS